jgi:hypothetical protein
VIEIKLSEIDVARYADPYRLSNFFAMSMRDVPSSSAPSLAPSSVSVPPAAPPPLLNTFHSPASSPHFRVVASISRSFAFFAFARVVVVVRAVARRRRVARRARFAVRVASSIAVAVVVVVVVVVVAIRVVAIRVVARVAARRDRAPFATGAILARCIARAASRARRNRDAADRDDAHRDDARAADDA